MQACQEWGARVRSLVMRAAPAVGHHHIAAAAAMAQLAELRARLGALLTDRGPLGAHGECPEAPPGHRSPACAGA